MASRRYKGRYRVDTWRHPHWDYSGSGVYFIRICTKNRNNYFGEIITTKEPNKCLMIHSHLGKIAYKYWQDIPEHFPSAKIDVFIIMPDHIHGILIINNTIVEAQNLAPLQSFVILELVDILAEPLGLPGWTLRFVFVLLCIGFIISTILSWVYDITPEYLPCRIFGALFYFRIYFTPIQNYPKPLNIRPLVLWLVTFVFYIENKAV